MLRIQSCIIDTDKHNKYWHSRDDRAKFVVFVTKLKVHIIKL